MNKTVLEISNRMVRKAYGSGSHNPLKEIWEIRCLGTPVMGIKCHRILFVFLLVVSTLSTPFIFANEQQLQVIGYIDGSRFHPLVVVSAGAISQADSGKLELKGKLRNAFRQTSESFSINKQEDYVDPFDRKNKPRRFGVVNKKITSPSDFFTLQSSAFPSQAPDMNKEIVRNFYVFFSRNEWGRHFFEGKVMLDRPAKEIAKKTGVTVYALTDLNNNSRPEVWVTYKLMYGEIGRMVYEQAGDGSNWEEIANHCYICD